MIDKKRRSRNLTLSDIIRGTLHCVNAGSEIAEQHYISTLDKFFNPDGSPVTKEVKINGNIKMNIPLICLSNHTNIDFEEIRIKTTLNLDELTQKDFESGLCFGNDSYQFTRGSFSVSLGGEKPHKSTSSAEVEMVFKRREPPEALARLIDSINNISHPESIKESEVKINEP